MSESIPDTAIEQAIATLMADVPAPVRDFILSPERDRIALTLSQKYQLHVDQAGAFEQAYLQMLLGAISPDEFSAALTRSGVPQDVTNGLVNDLNEQVFKPLQAREHATSIAPTTPQSTTPPIAPAPLQQREPLVPPLELVPKVQPPPVAPSLPAAPVAPPPAPTAAPPVSYEVQPPAAPDVHPGVRTMAADMQAVKEHRPVEPFFMHHEPEMPSYPAPVRTAPPPAPAPVAQAVPPPARSSEPPANLPGAPVVHEYSVDPYRESVE